MSVFLLSAEETASIDEVDKRQRHYLNKSSGLVFLILFFFLFIALFSLFFF